MKQSISQRLTYKPLKKGRYRCNQRPGDGIITNPDRHRWNLGRAEENARKQKEREIQRQNAKKKKQWWE